MHKKMKILSLLLVYVMLFASVATAADTAAFAEKIKENRFLKYFSPVIFAMDEARDLILEAQERLSKAQSSGSFGYVLSASQKYNVETDSYFAELFIINETGGFEIRTVDNPCTYNSIAALEDGKLGKIDYLQNKFILFNTRGTDKIERIEWRRTPLQQSFSDSDGIYLVNVVKEMDDSLYFYDTEEDITIGEQMMRCKYKKSGHRIIAISDEAYAGETLARISKNAKTLPAGEGNAVIQVSDGEIIRVFSFHDNFIAE